MKRAAKSLCAGRSFDGDLFYGDFNGQPFWPHCSLQRHLSIEHMRCQMHARENVSISRRFQCRSK